MLRFALPVACLLAGLASLPSSSAAPATTRLAATKPAATTKAAATQPATHAELMEAMTDFSRDLAAVLKTATDEKTAKAAVPKLEAARQRVIELRDATEAIGPMNDLTRQELMSRHGADLQSAMAAVTAEVERIKKVPALGAILGEPIESLSVFRAKAEVRD